MINNKNNLKEACSKGNCTKDNCKKNKKKNLKDELRESFKMLLLSSLLKESDEDNEDENNEGFSNNNFVSNDSKNNNNEEHNEEENYEANYNFDFENEDNEDENNNDLENNNEEEAENNEEENKNLEGKSSSEEVDWDTETLAKSFVDEKEDNLIKRYKDYEAGKGEYNPDEILDKFLNNLEKAGGEPVKNSEGRDEEYSNSYGSFHHDASLYKMPDDSMLSIHGYYDKDSDNLDDVDLFYIPGKLKAWEHEKKDHKELDNMVKKGHDLEDKYTKLDNIEREDRKRQLERRKAKERENQNEIDDDLDFDNENFQNDVENDNLPASQEDIDSLENNSKSNENKSSSNEKEVADEENKKQSDTDFIDDFIDNSLEDDYVTINGKKHKVLDKDEAIKKLKSLRNEN